MQNKSDNCRENKINPLRLPRFQIKRPHQKTHRRRINQINENIHRPRLDPLFIYVAVALKNIIPHRNKRKVDGNDILHHKRRIRHADSRKSPTGRIVNLIKAPIQTGQNRPRKYRIKTADQQKAQLFRKRKPQLFRPKI